MIKLYFLLQYSLLWVIYIRTALELKLTELSNISYFYITLTSK